MTQRLTKSDFAAEALAIIDESGFESLTIRKLSQRINVDPSTLYRHFRNKDDLMMAVVDLLADRYQNEEALAESPRARIEQQMQLTRRFLTAYPEMAMIISHSEAPSESTARIAAVAIEALKELGFTGNDLVTRYQALESFLIGTASYDLSLAPRNWEIRTARYRTMGYDAFREAATSPEAVAAIADEAFTISLRAILNAILDYY